MNKEDFSKLLQNKKALVAGGLVATTLTGYLGLCTMAQSSGSILANVTVNDISIGGMSKSEAISTIAASLDAQTQSTSIIYVQDEWNGVLQGRIVALEEIEAIVDIAYQLGRESFFSSGANYLSGVGSNQGELSAPLVLSELGKNQLESLLDEADSIMQGGVVQTSWEVDLDAEELRLTKGISGIAIDRVQAETATLSTLSSLSSSNNTHQVDLAMSVTLPTAVDLDALRNSIYTEPVSASLDNDLTVIDHILGVDLDTTLTSSLLSQAEEGETISVPLTITVPEQTSQDVMALLFADVLAEGSSLVTGTTVRKSNVAVATAFCNDVILMPGDVFSFYELCAPYSIANGYGEATAYVGGQTVGEIAGGICQVSSTIYYALLHTDLEIVSRRAHQFTVDYLPQGMDATVYSNTTDFKFRNSSPYPIKILSETVYKNGGQYTEITILGTKTSDVTIVPKSTVFNYTTQETEYVANSSIAVGKRSTVQSAYTGCSATVTRYHYDVNGNLIKEETLHTDRYNSRPAIVHYNPADAYSLGLSDTPPKVETESEPEEETPNQELPETDIVVPDVSDSIPPTTETVVPDVTPDEVVPDVPSDVVPDVPSDVVPDIPSDVVPDVVVPDVPAEVVPEVTQPTEPVVTPDADTNAEASG